MPENEYALRHVSDKSDLLDKIKYDWTSIFSCTLYNYLYFCGSIEQQNIKVK